MPPPLQWPRVLEPMTCGPQAQEPSGGPAALCLGLQQPLQGGGLFRGRVWAHSFEFGRVDWPPWSSVFSSVKWGEGEEDRV